MENDFWMALSKFSSTSRHLRRRTQRTINSVSLEFRFRSVHMPQIRLHKPLPRWLPCAALCLPAGTKAEQPWHRQLTVHLDSGLPQQQTPEGQDGKQHLPHSHPEYEDTPGLNTTETKEMIMDFRKSERPEHTTLFINDEEVERVESFKFLRVHISADPTRLTNISHQIQHGEPPDQHCCTSWFSSCTVKGLQRVVKAAEWVIGGTQPTIQGRLHWPINVESQGNYTKSNLIPDTHFMPPPPLESTT
ncbi:uncharacterized protein LOC133487871 isoform X2 [Phyllopteryx taeniolatus]|uniref:uncharacterized protein LOC133487871 isoform X2 n=1 Tax=Phyllopteryx taeniolatus TaxID=161469 RepID=UPI002AD436D7|nr:uncharacterized protein LOC133487871 isoform X2 [Phyllopteryx taeniolatus]